MTYRIGRMTQRSDPQRRSVRRRSGLFGSQTRTSVLLLLALLDESYPRELARVLRLSLSPVQQALLGLERDGVIVSRMIGRARRVTLNPRFYGIGALKTLLVKLAEADANVSEVASSLRRRPRRPDGRA